MIDREDPRLSAYALGEMDESERAAFEAELEESPEAKTEVNEIREAAQLLAAAHKAAVTPPSMGLGDERRKAILDAAAKPGASGDASGKEDPGAAKVVPITAKKPRRWAMIAAPALAAALAGIYVTSMSSDFAPEEAAVAQSDAAAPEAAAAATGEARADYESKDGGGAPPPAAAAPMRTRAKGEMGALGRAPNREIRSPMDSDVPIAPGGAAIQENPFIATAQDAKSTFSVDVDTASYSMLRRSLREGRPVAPQGIRIEEMINYFAYDYPPPEDEPFAASFEITEAPWATSHRLVRVGIKGREVPAAERPASNLVLLLDVSGSMNSPDKLPLVIKAMDEMTRQLDERDSVAIIVYAGATGVVLPPTKGDKKHVIRDALDQLSAGGSTNGGAGIERAYALAKESFIEGGTNRVILATDGDFNVGISSQDALVEFIEDKAKSGVFLTVLGFGSGNVRDTTLEQLANHGNGNYAYIDSFAEARRVLVEQISGTLVTIAKDVKIQVEFDPQKVERFRLIGYENRVLAHSDFDDDTKDAGEIGAGHTVTALYEVVPRGAVAAGTDLMDLKIRYKLPDGDTSQQLSFDVRDSAASFDEASADHRFAAAVASFGMLLRKSEHRGSSSYEDIESIARTTLGNDPREQRAEFLELVKLARQNDGSTP